MKRILVFTAAMILTGLPAAAKDLTPEEIDYKADFIVKIVDYVTWPDGAGTGANGEVSIAVLGESPLTPKLRELAAAKTREGTRMTVTTVTLDSNFAGFQVLFITTEDKAELARILKKVENVPVLTISDAYYFARHGVMVNFYTEEVGGKEKVKFEVNQITMGFAGLKMSSKLLKLATII